LERRRHGVMGMDDKSDDKKLQERHVSNCEMKDQCGINHLCSARGHRPFVLLYGRPSRYMATSGLLQRMRRDGETKVRVSSS
jgi:hypothetical protein